MSFLHIVNTNFEAELAQEAAPPLIASIQSHPIFMQLQFLPMLYADPKDGIGVTHAPDPSFTRPQWHLLKERKLPYQSIESWGASRSIQAWAQRHEIPYEMPPWDVVKQVNSKAFSFSESPQLPDSALIETFDELEKWDRQTVGPKVLKTCFGVSGKGHLFLPSDHVKRFAEKEFSAGRPLIAEPWVERKLDFSTQWMIHRSRKIEYLGATVCLSDGRGRYQANRVGDLDFLFGKYLPLLDRHRQIAEPILEKMAALGYFGNVGIDAMIWGQDRLHPVVEINARKTMGWVALEFSKRHFPKQTIALSYLTESSHRNLLPSAAVQENGTVIPFSRKLVVEVLAN
jgi:hypothetical protein